MGQDVMLESFNAKNNNPNASMDERISRTKEIFKLIGLENNDLETKNFMKNR